MNDIVRLADEMMEQDVITPEPMIEGTAKT